MTILFHFPKVMAWVLSFSLSVTELGGTTSLDNCQILQTRVNRLKGNRDNDRQQMRGYSCEYQFRIEELDAVELAVYGDVKRADRQCRSPSIMEQWTEFKERHSKQGTKLPPCKHS